MTQTLKQFYLEQAVPELQKKLGEKNLLALPRISAVKVHVGIGSSVANGKDYEDIVKTIAMITGQKPVVTKAKKAISNFKLKIGMPSGVLVTLRGKRMHDFLTKLIHVVMPRIRDFRGISKKAFDGHGGYNLGIREHSVFPEVKGEDVSKLFGIQITIQTTAKNDKEGYALLKTLQFPFKD